MYNRYSGVLLLLAMASASAQAASPGYIGIENASPPLSLGHGFVQNDLTKVPLYSCFTSDQPTDDQAPPSDISISFTTTSSTQSLLTSLGVDLEASYHSIMTSVDTKFGYSEKVSNDQYAATTLISASIDYPNRRLKNAALKPDYKKMLEDGATDEFIDKCGARIAVSEKRGIRLYVLVTVSNASASLRQAMYASVNGSYGIGPLSASAKAQFNQEMQSNKSGQSVNVEVFGRGNTASGIEAIIRASIKGKTSLDEIGEALATLVRSLSAQNATTLGYFVSDIPDIAVAQKDPWSLEKQSRLRTMFETYATIAAKRTILRNLVNEVDPRYVNYRDTQFATMRSQINQLDDAGGALVAAHGDCRAARPPMIGPCLTMPASVAAALAIETPGPIRKPGALFAIGVRNGPAPTNSALGEWRVMSIEQADSVFLSPVANADASTKKPDFSDYFTRFKKRLKSASSTTRRFQEGIAVRGEEIVSAELVAQLTASSTIGIPDNLKIVSLQGWGSDDLKLHVAADRLGWFREYGRGYNADDLFFRIQSGYLDPPPAGCNGCADYAEPPFKPYPGDIAVEKPILDLVKRWLFMGAKANNAGIRNGTASVVLKIRDRFTPDTLTYNVVEVKWEDTGIVAGCFANSVEKTCSHKYDVTYQFNTSEKSERAQIDGTYSWEKIEYTLLSPP